MNRVRVKSIAVAFPGELNMGVLFTAEIREEIVGTVFVKLGKGGPAEFNRLYVKPTQRKKGIGRRLLAEAHDRAKAAGCRSLTAYVKKGNAGALSFYQREGFNVVYQFADGDDLIWRPIS